MLPVYIAIVCVFLYVYFTRNHDHWKNKGVEFVKPLPLVGNIASAILMKRSLAEVFAEIYNSSTQPFVGFFIFNRPCLLIRDLKLIKNVLVTDFQHFCDRNVANNKRDDPISTHILFVLKNPDWKVLRHKITPIFTAAKIKNMTHLMEEVAVELVDYLNRQIEVTPEIEIKNVCVRFTVDVVSSAAFGINAFSFKHEKSDLFCTAKRLTDWDDFWTTFRMRCYFMSPAIVKFFRMKFLNPQCLAFLKKSFLEIMDQRIASKNVRHDLIDLLLQIKGGDKNDLEDDVLVSQGVSFFLAGFETTSSTISFALYELARHPEIQTKLRNEINEVCKKHGKINYDSLKDMIYLDMCVKEVMRKYPSVPHLERQAMSDYKIPGTEIIIAKGTPVYIPIFSIQNNAQYFPHPKIFDPERFSKSNENIIHPSTFMPFGEGPRSCIGMRFGSLNAKIGLASIIKNFRLETCKKTPTSITFHPKSVVLASLKGITLKLSKIHDSE